MKMIILMAAMTVAVSSFAQTRVRENVKQQNVVSEEVDAEVKSENDKKRDKKETGQSKPASKD